MRLINAKVGITIAEPHKGSLNAGHLRRFQRWNGQIGYIECVRFHSGTHWFLVRSGDAVHTFTEDEIMIHPEAIEEYENEQESCRREAARWRNRPVLDVRHAGRDVGYFDGNGKPDVDLGPAEVAEIFDKKLGVTSRRLDDWTVERTYTNGDRKLIHGDGTIEFFGADGSSRTIKYPGGETQPQVPEVPGLWKPGDVL